MQIYIGSAKDKDKDNSHGVVMMQESAVGSNIESSAALGGDLPPFGAVWSYPSWRASDTQTQRTQ